LRTCCNAAAYRTDARREDAACARYTQARARSRAQREVVREGRRADMTVGCPPPPNVIGDGGFVYHIWRDSDTARPGIGRERQSFTKQRSASRSFTNKAGAHGSCSSKQTLSAVTRGRGGGGAFPLE